MNQGLSALKFPSHEESLLWTSVETKITSQNNTPCSPLYRLRAVPGTQISLHHTPSQPHMQKSAGAAQIQIIKFILAAGCSPGHVAEETCSCRLAGNTFALGFAPYVTQGAAQYVPPRILCPATCS